MDKQPDTSLVKKAPATPLQLYTERIKKQNEDVKVKLTNCEMSSDGFAWAQQGTIDLAGLLECLVMGEHVYIRANYVEVYPSGRTSLAKAGPTFELTAREMLPAKLVSADEQQ